MSDKNGEGRRASTAHTDPPMDVDMVKAEAQHTEDAVPKPESIRNMTDEELQVLRTKMVRKMDAVIMPIMGILYLLNC